jgi:hypothetical protein
VIATTAMDDGKIWIEATTNRPRLSEEPWPDRSTSNVPTMGLRGGGRIGHGGAGMS